MRMMTRLGIALGIVAGAIAAVLWSWTYTPLGRLDLPAALVARLGTAAGPIDMSPEARAASNDRARSLGLSRWRRRAAARSLCAAREARSVNLSAAAAHLVFSSAWFRKIAL